MDYRWYFAFISIGCILIMISPQQDNMWPLMGAGLAIVVINIVLCCLQMKKKKEK